MKNLLQSAYVSTLLMYGGLALLMWPKALKIIGIISYSPSWKPFFLIGGSLMAVAGLALHLYQAEGDFKNLLKGYLLKLMMAAAILVVMMATGLITTPPFLKELW